MHKLLAAALLALGLAAQAQTSQQPVQGLLVRLKPTVESERESPQAARERMRSVAGAVGVPFSSERAVGTRHQLLRLPNAQSGEVLDATIRRLRLHPDVQDVEPDVRVKRLAVPNDPDYSGLQWNLQSSSAFPAALNMPAAWDITTGRAAGVVAVLDIGVRTTHPDLAGKLLAGYDFVSEVEYANDGNGRDADPSDPGDWVSDSDKRSPLFSTCEKEDSSWHGTFIAGQIAAATNNGRGVAGIDWQGKVLPVRIAGKCGALLSDLLDGIRWAAGLSVAGVPDNPTPARILNLSFGGDSACSPSYQDVINEIATVGALLVVAAGNEQGPPRRPADCDGVLAVGAVQADGLKTWYSNFGARVGITAPGGSASVGIWSLDNGGITTPGLDTYGAKAGTSFSSPQAAGVAALMLAVNPLLSPDQLVARIKASARPHVVVANAPACSSAQVACNCTTLTCGAGLLDGGAAVLAAGPALAPTANVVPVRTVEGGSTVLLDGRNSLPSTGAAVSTWRWEQVSGPQASIASPAAAQTNVTLPAGAGRYVFRLVVTDSAGRRDEAAVGVTATAAPSGGGSGGGGGGGGNTGWLWGLGLWALAMAAWRQRRRA